MMRRIMGEIIVWIIGAPIGVAFLALIYTIANVELP